MAEPEEPFYTEKSMADFAWDVVSGGTYSAEVSDFFVDDSFTTYIAPFPEKSPLEYFIGYLADGLLFEETTETDIGQVIEKAKRASAADRRMLPFVPVDKALANYWKVFRIWFV